MDKLLQPNLGLMVWTVVTFLILVAVLTKVAWKPILDGINKREEKIRGDIERAEKSQKEAEALRLQFESQLNDAQKNIQGLLNQARLDGEKSRAQLVTLAKEESAKILDKGRRDLADETERLKGELRHELASLSLSVAEKALGRSLDAKIQEAVLKESLESIGEVKR